MIADLLVTRKPKRQKKNRSDFCNFRRLKSDGANSDPAARAVDAHAEVRSETKRKRNKSEPEPNPPSALPKMIIDERGGCTNDKANSQPKGLAFDEKINITVTVARKGTRAKKHYDPAHEKTEHGQKQKISALAMHLRSTITR